MKVENAVYPMPEQIQGLLADGGEGPVAMLNLLKCRDKAKYADGRETDLSGRDCYMQLYGVPMQKIVNDGGGRLLYTGMPTALVVGEVEDEWDAVAIMEYPSRQAFAEIVAKPEVAEIGVHREAGLEGQILIAMTTAAFTTP